MTRTPAASLRVRSAAVRMMRSAGVRLPARSGHLDLPLPGSIAAPPLTRVEGWALPRAALSRVEITVNGGPPTLARVLATQRADVAGWAHDPAAELSGFECDVDLAAMAAGEVVRIRATAVDATGERTGLGEVQVVVGPPPRVSAEDEARLAALTARTAALRAARSQPEPGSPTRLMVVTHHLGLGGGQLYLSELLEGLLPATGAEAFLVSPADGVLRALHEAQGVAVHIHRPYPTGCAEAYESSVHELAALAVAHRADLVLVNSALAGIGADVAARLGLPAIWAIHEHYSIEGFWAAAAGIGGADPWVKARFIDALASASSVVFEADATRQLYESATPLGRPRTIPYGIPVARIDNYLATATRDELRDRVKVADGACLLLCLGTYEPRKAQAALVAAFAQVAGDHPHAVLALVGHTGSDYSHAVANLVDRMGLASRVRLVGITDDVYSWYGAADVFVLGSDVESLPRSALEAMAFGTPVLATRAGGLGELVEDGVNGWLCDPRDVSALAAGLRRALSAGGSTRATMGAAARRRVLADHDSSGYVAAYAGLVGELCVPRQALRTAATGP